MPPETFSRSRSRALAPAPDGGPARGGCAVRNPKLKPKALRKRKAEAQSGWPSARSPGQRQRARRPADASPRHLGRRGRWALPPLRHPAGPALPRPEGAAAVCPPGDGEEEGAATAFVLLPMLRAALLSTVPSAPSVSVSASADETNRLLEAGAATGSAEELSRLRRAGNVRVLRLHGTRAEGGEEAEC